MTIDGMTRDRSRGEASSTANDDAIATRYLAEMTLEEKATLLTGDSAWTTAAVPRLGSAVASDGRRPARGAAHAVDRFDGLRCPGRDLLPDGVEHRRHVGSGPPARDGPGDRPRGDRPRGRCRPRAWGQHEALAAVRPELRVLLGGPVSSPASLAVGWIEGIQSLGVGASLKHLAVNNQETRRMSVSAEVDERALREIYLPAFEQAVRPWPGRGPSCAPTTGSTASMRRSIASC